MLDRYDVVETSLDVGGRTIRLAQVRDINALVDAIDDLGPDERLPYFATLWPAAIALAEVVLARPALGRTLELGAGLGLGSIAAALRGADVIATDWEQDAIAFARHNASLNGVAVSTRLCDWRDWSNAGDLARAFDAVIGADLFYEERNVEPVVRSLALLLAPGGIGLFADPGRPHLARFETRLVESGFSVDRVSCRGAVVLSVQSPAIYSK